MGTVARLKQGDFYLLDGINERVPEVTSGLIAHHPFDGSLENVMMMYRNNLITTTNRDFYGPQFPDHPYAGMDFYIEGWVRKVDATSNVTTSIGFSYSDTDTNPRWVPVKSFNLNDIEKWTHFFVKFTIPANFGSNLKPWIQININDETPGYKVQYKDVRYWAPSITGMTYSNINITSEGLAVDKATVNLASNPSFEVDSNFDGLSDNWSYFIGEDGIDGSRVAIYSRPVAIHHGVYCQRLYLDATGNTKDSGIYSYVYGITTGVDYTVSAYIKTNSVNKVKIVVRFRDSTSSILEEYQSQTISEPYKLERLRVTATAPANADRIQIMIRGINSPKEWFEVDSLMVTQSSDLTSFVPDSSGDSSFKLPKNYVKSTGTLVFDFMPLMYSNQNPIFSSGIDGGFDLLMQSSSTSSDSRLRFYSSSTTSVEESGNWFPQLNKFYRVILTWVNNGEAKLYIDGALVKTISNCGNWYPYYDSNGTGFWLGSGIRSVTSMVFKNVSFYNRVLSQTEIDRLFNPIFELRKESSPFGTMHSLFVESPINIGNDCYHIPLGNDGRDKGKVIVPVVFNNIQSDNGFSWVGGDATNLLFDNGVKNWTFVEQQTSDYSFMELIPNERYIIRRLSTEGNGIFYFYVPSSKLQNGATYTFSFKYKFLSGDTLNFLNWCDNNFTNIYKTSKGGYYFAALTGSATTYDSNHRHLTLSMPPGTEIEIWDLQLEQRSFYTPYTKIRPVSKIAYNLYNSIGLDWSGNWSILYWKIPVGSRSNTDLSGYNIESLGCNNNSVGGGYLWFGKGTGSNSLSIGSGGQAIDPSIYFNKVHMVSIVKNGSEITVKFWLADKVYTFNKTVSTSAPNYFVCQYGYDLLLGGFDNSSPPNTFYRDLLIYKRSLSDSELELIYKSQMKYKSGVLYIQGSLADDLQP